MRLPFTASSTLCQLSPQVSCGHERTAPLPLAARTVAVKTHLLTVQPHPQCTSPIPAARGNIYQCGHARAAACMHPRLNVGAYTPAPAPLANSAPSRLYMCVSLPSSLSPPSLLQQPPQLGALGPPYNRHGNNTIPPTSSFHASSKPPLPTCCLRAPPHPFPTCSSNGWEASSVAAHCLGTRLSPTAFAGRPRISFMLEYFKHPEVIAKLAAKLQQACTNAQVGAWPGVGARVKREAPSEASGRQVWGPSRMLTC